MLRMTTPSDILVLSSSAIVVLQVLVDLSPCWAFQTLAGGWTGYQWSAWGSVFDTSDRNAPHEYTLWRLPTDSANSSCVVLERALGTLLGRYSIHMPCKQLIGNLPATQLCGSGHIMGTTSHTHVTLYVQQVLAIQLGCYMISDCCCECLECWLILCERTVLVLSGSLSTSS